MPGKETDNKKIRMLSASVQNGAFESHTTKRKRTSSDGF